jgi:hypothetical protein
VLRRARGGPARRSGEYSTQKLEGAHEELRMCEERW